MVLFLNLLGGLSTQAIVPLCSIFGDPGAWAVRSTTASDRALPDRSIQSSDSSCTYGCLTTRRMTWTPLEIEKLHKQIPSKIDQ